jgi:DNA-directed RNA polymerase subunit RPC12/RpoP
MKPATLPKRVIEMMTDIETRAAERRSRAASCSAVFESENLMSIRGPCGHEVAIERAIEDKDRYACPICGLRYRVEQDPPKVYPSGFIMPGNRHVVIEAQSNLPTCPPNS